jgi:hypothetical protein
MQEKTRRKNGDTNEMYDLHLKGAFHLTITVFWDVALRGLSTTGRRFRGTYCLHHQPYSTIHKVAMDTSPL